MQKEDNKKNNKSSNITEQENPTTVLDLFQSNFKDKKIAVIGSAFTLKNSNCMDKTHPFRFFPPSLKLLKVLHSILLSSSKESSKISEESSSKITIGTDYVGVHIRFGDKWMTKKLDCNNKEIKETYYRLFEKLQLANVSSSSSSSSSSLGEGEGGEGDLIYIGYSHPMVKECLHKLTPQDNKNVSSYYYYNVKTVYDILSKDVESMELFNTIKVEESTRILVLDQLLLGLGSKFIVEQDYGNMPGKSSFQSMIQSRHNKRQELISTIRREG